MSEQTSLTTLKDAIFEVMETMFFLCPEVVDPEDLVDGQGGAKVAVTIHTTGDNSYRIGLQFTEALLRKMAAGLFGEAEASFETAQLHDLAREAANMVGGAFLHNVDPSRQEKLSLPELVDAASLVIGDRNACSFEVEEEPLLASLASAAATP